MSAQFHPCFSFASYRSRIISSGRRHAEDLHRPSPAACRRSPRWPAPSAPPKSPPPMPTPWMPKAAFPQEAHRRAEGGKTAGHHGARRAGRRRGQCRRGGGCLLPPGPRLFLHRHDLRHASGESRLRRPSRHGQRLAPRLHGPHDCRPAAAGLLHHRRQAAAAMCAPPKRRWNNPTAASCWCATPA